MNKTNKHRVTKILNFSDFSGGLNFLLPTDMLADNECSVMDQLMFDPASGMLTTRPAFMKKADLQEVSGVYFSRKLMLILAGGTLFYIVNDGSFSLQIAEGDPIISVDAPIFAPWDNGVIFTTGGDNLYFFNNGAVTSYQPKDPENKLIRPTHCFVRHGRVVIYRANYDTLYYSAVGEIRFEYGELESDAKYIEIGYKDMGDIACIIPLSMDIIIFKTDGIIYRLIGEYPNWKVLEIARNIHTMKNSAIQLFNSVIFLTREGLMSLDTVQNYGDIQVNKNVSRKIDPILSRQLDVSTGLFYLPSIQSLFINSNPSGANFLMSFANGAFTRWQLPFVVKSAGEFGGRIYFISHDGIYENTNSPDENGEKLKSRILSKTYLNRNKWLLKKTDIYVKPTERGKINVSFGVFSYDVEPMTQKIAFADHIKAYLNKTPLIDTVWQHFSFQDVYSNERIQAEITILGRGSVKIEAETAIIGD